MGTNFDDTVMVGYGFGKVELLGPCESPIVFTGHKGTPPKKMGEPFELNAVSAKIGVGIRSVIPDPVKGIDHVLWSESARLTITDITVAWYELDGNTEKLDVAEEPAGSDTFVLSKDGEFMGRVTLAGVTFDGA